MRFFRIFTKREFEHNGEHKTKWSRVGELKFTDGGGKYMKLYLFPDTEYFLFEESEENEELPTVE